MQQGKRVARYLSKNNNNILRLNGIRQAFPQALVLIPFRDPLSHARSLLRQHCNFVATQAEDPFVRSYMKWLAHHEFGLDHRPFRLCEGSASNVPSYGADTMDYWLEMWRTTYEWLERSAPEDAIFVCYEDLCSDTEVWSRIAKIAGIATVGEECNNFRLSNVSVDSADDSNLAE